MEYLEKSYTILKKIFSEGAYVQIALNESYSDKDTAVVTKIVYGTLENYFLLSFNLSIYVKKKPSNSVNILLLMGAYCLKFMKIPDYALVNGIVELSAKIGKVQLKGFINSVLRKISLEDLKHPSKDSSLYEQVKYNLPEWFISSVKKDYPEEYNSILGAEVFEMEHVRLNKSRMINKEFEKIEKEFFVTETGYFVRGSGTIIDLFNEGKLTYQALASTLVVEAMGNLREQKVLDLCAAPGGKAVYVAEKGAEVVACDIHEHRLELITSYAKRMGVDLKTVKNDGTRMKKAFVDYFDVVLVDAPCSGLGVIKKKQDMIIGKILKDVNDLSFLQKKLLSMAKNYVKVGGILIYSTCTIMKAENEKVVEDFLSSNSNFSPESDGKILPEEGSFQFLPDGKGMDGYYIARMRRSS